MIYELRALKHCHERCFNLPLQSKPAIMGINLLRCSKQIHNEVSRRLGLWDSTWALDLSSPSSSVEPITDLSILLAKSGLHDLALAKIDILCLRFNITTNTPAAFDFHGLEGLLRLKSLTILCITLYFNIDGISLGTEDLERPKNLTFVTEAVMRILAHVPTSVEAIGWWTHPGETLYLEGNAILNAIAEKHKYARGSAYTSLQNSGSLSQPIEISVSQHF
jgi:hypothetical protein